MQTSRRKAGFLRVDFPSFMSLRVSFVVETGFGFSDVGGVGGVGDFGDHGDHPTHPLPIPDWRSFARHHPNSSQIGVYFRSLTSIGVDSRKSRDAKSSRYQLSS
jgi:hypothetical protein